MCEKEQIIWRWGGWKKVMLMGLLDEIEEKIEQVRLFALTNNLSGTPSEDPGADLSQLAKTKRKLELAKDLWAEAVELNSRVNDRLDLERERLFARGGELREHIGYLKACLGDARQRVIRE